MVLFLLLSVPCVYLLIIQFMVPIVNPVRSIRNPMVIGAATFFLYLILDNISASFFSDLYRWQDAFLRAAVEDQLIPLVFAIFFFILFFRKINTLAPADQELTVLSFLAGFLFLLNIHDLIMQINVLDAVDLFYRPFGRVVLLIVVSWSLLMFRVYLSKRYIFLLNVLVVHLLISFACAAQYMHMPILGIILIVPLLVQAIAIIMYRKKLSQFFTRVFGI